MCGGSIWIFSRVDNGCCAVEIRVRREHNFALGRECHGPIWAGDRGQRQRIAIWIAVVDQYVDRCCFGVLIGADRVINRHRRRIFCRQDQVFNLAERQDIAHNIAIRVQEPDGAGC